MKRWLWGSLAMLLMTVVMGSSPVSTAREAAPNPPAAKPVRIGVYDPRAVAVAYAHSQAWNRQLDAKRKERERAKAANDQAKVKELEAWGQAAQVRLHLQGFAGAPVDDILAQVKDQLPKVADAADVQAICLRPDYTTERTEIVDVTDDLVKLWSPDAKVLKMIADLRKVTPYPIEQIAKMGANE